MDEREKKTYLQMAVDLDEMDKDLASASADFLEQALKDLKAGRRLSTPSAQRLEALHRKHFPDQYDDHEEQPAAAAQEDDEEDLEAEVDF